MNIHYLYTQSQPKKNLGIGSNSFAPTRDAWAENLIHFEAGVSLSTVSTVEFHIYQL